MTDKTATEAVELTPRQSRFIEEYVLDLNATRAAETAGYSKANARQQGARLLTKANIKAAIAAKMQGRSDRTQIDSDYVLRRLQDIDQLDVADILDNAGNILPVKQWPKVWRQSITAADLHEIQAGDVMTVVKKIKWPDKLKTLELMGKHVNVKAFEAEKDAGAEDMATALSKLADKLPG